MIIVARTDQAELTRIELWGLYNILRSSYLNVLYYGRRASTWSKWNLGLQIVASGGSLGAVTGFLASQTSVARDHELAWRIVSAVIGTLSGLCAAIPPIMGHSDKINRFERLHFAYCELFQLTQRAVMDIRREGIITHEQIGVAKLLSDLYSRLGQQDEPDFKTDLRDKCEIEVREKYPDGSLWYPDGNGNETAGSTTTKPTALSPAT